MRLMADVAALKNNSSQQRQTLIDGLQQLFKTKLGWLCVADNWRPGRQTKLVHQVLTSNMQPNWLRYMSDFTVNNPVTDDLYSDSSICCDDGVQIWQRTHILKAPHATKRYAQCIRMVELLEIGADVVAAYRADANRDRIIAFSLHRDIEAPLLTADENALVRLAIEELRDLETRGHISYRDNAERELPPRLAQMLDLVLRGRAPKQIAGDLNLSVHTVREHMRRLYQHYGVSGRDDLAAKFLR